MSYFVYMLKEKSSNTTYVGYTKNLEERELNYTTLEKGLNLQGEENGNLFIAKLLKTKPKLYLERIILKKIENLEILLKTTTDEDFNTITI